MRPVLTLPPDLPSAGARLSGVVLRAALALLGMPLSVTAVGVSGWLVVGVALSLGAAWLRRHLLGWVLILFLAAGQLAREATLSWRLLILLAGIHLVHVLSLELPARSWIGPWALLPSLRRLVRIQIPAQLTAINALLLLGAGSHGHRPVALPEFTLIGALALAGVGWGLAALHSPGPTDLRES